MLKGHEHDQYTRSVYIRVLFRPIFLYVFLEKDCNGKKDRCALFGCSYELLFPEKYTVRFSFCPKSARKY